MSSIRALRGLLSILILLGAGCVSTERLNQGFRDIDEVWGAEIEANRSSLSRTFHRPAHDVLDATAAVLRDLGMQVLEANAADGVVVAKAQAPTPLTRNEWRQVVEKEGDRAKEVGGWMFKLPRNPSGYHITVISQIRANGSSSTVSLEYRLENPGYEQYGLEPSRNVPPAAALMGADKIFREITARIAKTRP